MSAARGQSAELFTVIADDLRSGKLTNQVLVAGTRDAIQKGNLNRVFDHLPRVIGDEALASLASRNISMVEAARFVGENNLTPNFVTQMQMEKWIKDMIEMGMAELLDNKGKLKQRVVDLFGWGDLGHLDKNRLMSAYVGAVMGQITQHLQTYFSEHSALNIANAKLYAFISKQYPHWIEQMMIEKGFESTSYFSSPVSKVATVTGAAVLFGVVGVAATVGFFAVTASAAPAGDANSLSNFDLRK